jgi:hypothetical protein
MRTGDRVVASAEYLPDPDGQPGLLEHFARRGPAGRLARLELAARQDPRRSAVLGPAADQQDAAVVGDNRDRDGLAVRFGQNRDKSKGSQAVGWPIHCPRVAGRIAYSRWIVGKQLSHGRKRPGSFRRSRPGRDARGAWSARGGNDLRHGPTFPSRPSWDSRAHAASRQSGFAVSRKRAASRQSEFAVIRSSLTNRFAGA